MPRPALRPMRALPVLEPRRIALETCTFCPKLCRSACPVSNAEPRETLTPWGKMSAAWMAAHGDTSMSQVHAAPAWACTGCFACTAACDHGNPVADVLIDARAALAREQVAPEGARRVLARFDRHERETSAAVRALAPSPTPGAKIALVIGCGYLRGAPDEARDALRAAQALVGEPLHVVDGCCGLPLRLAGDAERFQVHARGLARKLAAFDSLMVVDAGCGLALRRHYPSVGAEIRGKVELLVEAAARRLSALAQVAVHGQEPIRWHDPCQLGRGLGIYEAPRQVLARAIGRPVAELRDARESTPCSGAGGLLPSTLPDVARSITDTRLEEHRLAGGGRVVTGCASSLMALRKRGRPSGVLVDDLVTYIARALEPGSTREPRRP
jgi:Fe-S oxidoreductase